LTNCTLGTVKRKHSRRAKRGRVLSQWPAAATKLPGGAKVSLTVGKK